MRDERGERREERGDDPIQVKRSRTFVAHRELHRRPIGNHREPEEMRGRATPTWVSLQARFPYITKGNSYIIEEEKGLLLYNRREN